MTFILLLQVGKDDSSDEDDEKEKKTGVYVPPRLVPMKYGRQQETY